MLFTSECLKIIFVFLDKLLLARINDTFDGLKVGKSFIEVACIISILYQRNVRSLYLFVKQIFLFEFLEPWMVDYVLHIVDLAQSLGLVLVKKFANNIFGKLRYFKPVLVLLWPSYLTILNEVVHLMLVLIVERRNTDDHFIDQHSKCPPV